MLFSILQISANFHFTDCFPKCFFLLLPVCNHSLIVTHHFVKHLYAVSPGISFLFDLPFTFSSLFLHHTVPPLHQSLSFHSISFYSFKIYLLTQFFFKAHTQKAFEGTCTTLNNQIQNDQHALYMYRDFVPFSLFRLLYLTLRNFKQIGALSHWVCDNHRLLVSIPLAWDCWLCGMTLPPLSSSSRRTILLRFLHHAFHGILGVPFTVSTSRSHSFHRFIFPSVHMTHPSISPLFFTTSASLFHTEPFYRAV